MTDLRHFSEGMRTEANNSAGQESHLKTDKRGYLSQDARTRVRLIKTEKQMQTWPVKVRICLP